MNFWIKVRGWYEGKMVPRENAPNSELILLGWSNERHWTAKCARVLVGFYLANWQWLIGTLMGAMSLWVALR